MRQLRRENKDKTAWEPCDSNNCVVIILTLKEFTDKSSLSLFHLNTWSLSKNIDDFERLIQSTKTDFDIKSVSESRITENKLPPIDMNIPNYSYEFCPTEANPGGTLIYIRNHLSCKTRNDLKIYKSFELESTFIEICNPEKININTGYIYKHPNTYINEFNGDYLNDLLDKLSKENKTIFLLGDFSINLLTLSGSGFLDQLQHGGVGKGGGRVILPI